MSKGIGEGDEEGAPWSKLDVQPRTVAGLTRCRGPDTRISRASAADSSSSVEID